MANRTFNQFVSSLEKGIVFIEAAVGFNSSSTPNLLAWNGATRVYTKVSTATRGVLSFTRGGTGNYTLTLSDAYARLLGCFVTFIGSANAAAPIWQVKVGTDPTNGQAFGTGFGAGLGSTSNALNLLTFSAQGTAADPANTEIAVISLMLQNSSAPS
jgi:hypothetical protein